MGMGDRGWLHEIESLGTESLFKLIFLVLSLLILAVLAASLPGLERVESVVPLSVTVLFRTAVTIVLIALMIRIARRSRPAIHRLGAGDDDLRHTVSAAVHWGVILLAVGFAYEGLRPAGSILLGYVGFTTFYPILFGMIALIPLAFLSVEIGLFAQQSGGRKASEDDHVPEFQTDEQRVHQLLDERSGAAYQREVAEVTGWSKAKVSRVLSGMEDDDLIVRFRVGREKIVCLPGQEPSYVFQKNRSSGSP